MGEEYHGGEGPWRRSTSWEHGALQQAINGGMVLVILGRRLEEIEVDYLCTRRAIESAGRVLATTLARRKYFSEHP